jgi:Holliday junction DNA helicase RuvB
MMSQGNRQNANVLPGQIKRGDDIIGDGPYPHDFTQFVGQNTARMQILTAITAAAKRGEALPHMLLASGQPGIGKTSLGKLTAHTLKVGYAELGGVVTAEKARPVLEAMQDRDVLFLDEIHRMVASGKKNAEWLLQLLQDGVLVLPGGTVEIPKITVIGATTDAQLLPETIVDRFPIQPILEPYTVEEAVQIAHVTASRLRMTLAEPQYHRIAAAADYNPRVMGRLLATVRDIQDADPTCADPVARAQHWTGFSDDGLTRLAQDYLMLLYGYGGVASLPTMLAVLGESVLKHTERDLVQRGFITVTNRGRELTGLGRERAAKLMDEKED